MFRIIIPEAVVVFTRHLVGVKLHIAHLAIEVVIFGTIFHKKEEQMSLIQNLNMLPSATSLTMTYQ